MNNHVNTEHTDTIVIGGGQAGLATGYHLKKHGLPFLILDANERVGDSWRNRWDSLRLFTPARFDALPGLKVPAPRNQSITKDEMGDYLELYARHFELPVRSSSRVAKLSRGGDGRFEIVAGQRTYSANNVVVAMGNFQSPKVPPFATELDAAIRQIHSHEYRSPSQLAPGPVLIVGAGNSGAEIAKEVAGAGHPTLLSGRDVGQLPFDPTGFTGRLVGARFVLRILFHRLLTVRTPMGRRMRPKVVGHSGPLIRVKGKELKSLGVERVSRTAGVEQGRPKLEDGRVLEVANVIWCTGFHPGFSWIELDIFDGNEPRHHLGIVDGEPGLYFVGLEFLYSLSSEMIHGVGRDAERVAKHVAQRTATVAVGTAAGRERTIAG